MFRRDLFHLVADGGPTSCIPPLVIAWDPTFGQERIWSATNPVTIQTDGLPWIALGGNLARRSHPPITIISDPRCHYQLSITPAYKLACFRFVATSAPCIASFSVALVLFILALQANATRKGEAVPSPLTALRTMANSQNRGPLILSAAVALAALLYPLFQSSRAHVAFLIGSALFSLALAFGLVTLLAITQAGLLRVGSIYVSDSGKHPASLWGRVLRGSHSRTVRLVLGSLSVLLSLLYHPGLPLLFVLAFQTWETLSALATGPAPVYNDQPGLGKSDSRTGFCSKRGSTGAGEETPDAPSVNGSRGNSSEGAIGAGLNEKQNIGLKPTQRVNRPANHEHREYLQPQSARLLLTFHGVVMMAPALLASLLRTSGMREAPGALDASLVFPQILETFSDSSEGFGLAGASARRGVPASVAVAYLALGVYVFHGGLTGEAHRISFACTGAATVDILLAVSRKLSM